MTPSNWSIHTQENTERKIRVEVKSQFLQNLSRLKGQFIKIIEDLTKQEKILVKEWQDKANNKNEKDNNKIYKWRVRGSPQSRLYLKKVFC